MVIMISIHCLTRILSNLMSNAQKYTADRFGTVLKREGEQVKLSVYNTLADCSDVDISRVFEPFYRMDARTAGGSGLGLYVVKLLFDRLGWTVNAEINDGIFLLVITA